MGPSPSIADLLGPHREAILRIAASHGAEDVRIFGSFARNAASEASDLDLLVRMQQGRSLLDLIGLSQDLEATLHRPVDVVSENALSPHLRQRILAEAIRL